MIQRISELDQYYFNNPITDTRQTTEPTAPNFTDDYLSLNTKIDEYEANSLRWPYLSTGVLFEVSRAPVNDNGIIQSNEAVSYYKSYKVGADFIGAIARTNILEYFIENPFSLGEPGDAEHCPGGEERHDRYPANSDDPKNIFSIFKPSQFHGPVIFHNTIDVHDGATFRGNVIINNPGHKLSVVGDAYFDNDINGCCLSARWADLAEVYETDGDYPPGTLVAFGGEKEITVAKYQANAVVTTKPGVVLNSSCQTGDSGRESSDQKFLGIALTGRTPVRVVGPVKKFDRLCISDTPGVACKKENMPLRNTIGIALESNDDPGEKLVMSTVQLNLG